MTSDPHTITRAQVADLLAGLGLDRDIRDLASVHLEPYSATVVRYRRNAEGHLYVAGNDAAKETVTIRIQD
jgi:hypothetical protein